MLNPQRVAEVLSRGLAKSGMSAEQLAKKVGMHPKRLQRWLHKGITQARGGDADALRRVCQHLGVDVWEQPSTGWIAELSRLFEIVVRRNNSFRLISDLLEKVRDTARVAAVAERLAKERPDLVPLEMVGDSPFSVYFTLAAEVGIPEEDRLSSSSEDHLYDRLLRLLLAKRALDDGKGPAIWTHAQQFHMTGDHRKTLEAQHPNAAKHLSKRRVLESLLDRINENGVLNSSSKEEREAEFWEKVAVIEQDCQPLVIASEELEENATRFPRAIADLRQGDHLAVQLQIINEKHATETTWKRRRAFWETVKEKEEWKKREQEARKPRLAELLRKAGMVPNNESEAVTVQETAGSALTESLPVTENGASQEKQQALSEASDQAAKPERQVPVSRGLGSKLSQRKARTMAEVPTDLWPPDLQKRQGSAKSFGLVRWTGGKWRQAAAILKHFPDSIETYYEPFLGGGAVLHRLLASDINVRRIRCSDICQPLVEVWNLMMNDPSLLASRYADMWEELGNKGKDFYNEVRDRFNQTGDPCQFFFLLRTCRIGSVRFNRKGYFTTSLHFGRRGAHPDKAKAILDDWHSKLQDRDVKFTAQDYRLLRSEPGDFLYLDPPYASIRSHLFYGKFDFEPFFPWLVEQQGGYALSLNGFVGEEDRTVAVPEDLYDEHLQIEQGVSANRLLSGMTTPWVTNSLYIKRR